MVLNKIKNLIRDILINRKNRKRLKNKNFSVISSNCNGALILNELNQRFNSPTVNLFFEAEDYIKFLERLDFYLQKEIIELKQNEYKYPIGQIDDIKVHFMHYKDFMEAKKKWEDRLLRLNKQNLFVLMTDRDGCNENIIKRFDKLPFENKIIFTNKNYKNIKSAFYIKGFESNSEVGELSKYKSKLSLLKYYDQFDFIKWFNSNA